jgi:hypothetical protein
VNVSPLIEIRNFVQFFIAIYRCVGQEDPITYLKVKVDQRVVENVDLE